MGKPKKGSGHTPLRSLGHKGRNYCKFFKPGMEPPLVVHDEQTQHEHGDPSPWNKRFRPKDHTMVTLGTSICGAYIKLDMAVINLSTL